jgi:AP2-associated kinase
LENVLITSGGEFKLCDFGSCTARAQVYLSKEDIAAEEERVGKFTTAMYRAPEMVDIYSKALVNEKVDIWALGCILFTTAFFEHPFQTAGNLGIINGKYDIPEANRFSKYIETLLKKIFTTE